MSVAIPEPTDVQQYVPNTWVDVPPGATPPPDATRQDAAALTRIETGLVEASAVALAAWALAQALDAAPGSGSGGEGEAPDLSGYATTATTDALAAALAQKAAATDLASIATALAGKASTADVDARFTQLAGLAPEALDTLGELATRLVAGDTAAEALVAQVTALATALAGKAATADVPQLALDAVAGSGAYAPLAGGKIPAQYLPAGGGGAVLPTRRFDIRDYGAKVDGIRVLDAVTTAGQPTVTSASRPFVAGDVGKTIGVAMPVTGGRDVWISTIVSVAGGVATLTTNAPSSMTGAECAFGTPDDAAVAAAELAARTATAPAFGIGGTVYLPPGRTIVTDAQVTHDYVSWAGENREVSIITVIKDGRSWMTPPNEFPDPPLTGAVFSRFKIEARLHSAASYSSSNKPFNIYNARRCVAEYLWLENTPATSIPFDEATDACTIAFNLVTNPGRMNDGSQPGGSGIGLGTAGVSNSEPTLVIGNTILSSTGRGVNGIFTENQSGTGTDATASRGYRIIGNYVRGMRFGITDAGSYGTLITGNTVEACSVAGIAVNGGSFYKGRPGTDFTITDNTVTGGVGTTDGHGILLDLAYTGHTNVVGLRGLVADNTLTRNAGHGLAVKLAAIDSTSLVIRDNVIRENGLSGLAAKYPAGSGTAVLRRAVIESNVVAANGRRGVGSDRCGLRFEVPLVDCVVNGNDCYDDQATPTQTYGMWLHTGVTFTGGQFARNRLRGNATAPVNVITAPGWGTGALVEGNTAYSYGTPVVVPVGPSPFTYTAGPGAEDLYVDGGAVTAIAKGGVTLYAATGRIVRLRAGEAVTITYTSAPSVVADPSAVPAVVATAPGAPGVSAAPGTGKNTVTITAPASSGGSPVTGYAVYRSTSSSVTTASTLVASPAAAGPVDDTTAEVGVAYYYAATATNAAGTSVISTAAGPVTATAAAAVPAKPTLAAASGPGKVTLSGGSAGATTYKVYRGTTAGFTPGAPLATGVALPYEDTAVTPGTPYYYRVAGTNTVGDSVLSDEATATPGAVATGPVIADSYTAPDGTTLTGRSAAEGATSAAYTVDGGTFAITGGSVKPASGTGAQFATVETGRTAARVRGTVGALNGTPSIRRTGLVFAYVDSANYVRAVAQTAGQWLLSKIVAGVATTVVTSTVTAASGDVVEIARAADGTTWTLTVNGTPRGTGQITDPVLVAATRAGLYGSFQNTNGTAADQVSAWSDLQVHAA